MKLKDRDLRISLHQEIKDHFSYDKTTQIIDELQICNGVARVDIAAINGALHGYEIKSESDTLIRLPNQTEQYNKVFDYVYFVCSENQIDKAYRIIPEWWGIYLAANVNGNAKLSLIKDAEKNEKKDSFSLLQFLNKEELICFGLKYDLGTPSALKKLQKYRLWQILAAKVDNSEILMDELSDFLRFSLKTREGFKTRLLQM